jgi:hypothetical protein
VVAVASQRTPFVAAMLVAGVTVVLSVAFTLLHVPSAVGLGTLGWFAEATVHVVVLTAR